MANAPRKDNVVKFRKPDPKAAPKPGGPATGGKPGARPPSGKASRPAATPADLANLIRGREGVVGLIVIIALAIAIVAWQRLSGG